MGWTLRMKCTRSTRARTRRRPRRFIVTTWQSVYRLGPDWFDAFGCVFGDECHLFKAKSLSTMMNKCSEAEYRFGTTGTLDGTQVNKLVLEGLFGPTKRVTFTRDLQDKGTLAKLKIDMLMLDYPKEVRRINKDATYQEEVDFLVGHEPRNKLIRNLALTQTGNTLVLFQYVEKHGESPIQDDQGERTSKVFYVHGGTDVADREAIRGIVEGSRGSDHCCRLWEPSSTGINIRNLHNIVLCFTFKVSS